MTGSPALPERRGAATGRAALRRWVLLLYFVGVLGDVAWHARTYLTTGDRAIEAYEWVIGIQASLFWPVDLVAQALLASR
ncbi:MAG TPA: hypothetical protein VFA50_18490 [Stellaceae bacterium]|nr:hypothetical protein [Stellaceae bacterium]